MKHLAKRLLAFALAAVLLLPGSALAAFSDFPDGPGHWAEEALERAYEDGLVQGYEDGKLYPNASVSYAHVFTLLDRMLSPVKAADYAALGLSGSEWYAGSAARAYTLLEGCSMPANYDAVITRAQALTYLAKAFALEEAEPDYSALDAYPDSGLVTGQARDALAVLVSRGYVEGYDGKINPNAAFTRAEYISILYRLAENYIPATEVSGGLSGGTVVSGRTTVQNESFTQPLWLDCSTSNVTFRGVQADTVVFLSQKGNSVNLFSGSTVERLVLAGGTGNMSVNPTGVSSVGTVVVGDMPGTVTISGNVSRVEVVGNGQTVHLNASVDELVISGDNCTLVTATGVTIDSIRLLETACGNSLTIKAGVTDVQADGTGNTLTVTGVVDSLSLKGENNLVTGTGVAKTAKLHTTRSVMELRAEETVDLRDYGISGAGITLSAQEVLPAGETLTVTADITAPLERTCTASWLLEGVVVKEEMVAVGPEAVQLTFTHDYEYSEEMALSSTVELRLFYVTADDEEQTVSAQAAITLENYDEAYYEKYNREQVLATVTTGYKGNYTLQWAEEHDYDERTKEVWINAKNYSSTTDYLIWINITYQRVNIFRGSRGNWELIRSNIVGTGAPGTATPVGVYTIWARSAYGWVTGTYCCRPVVNFKTGSGYAFHSRLYNPAHTYLTDPSIGFPVSHGCIRMYDEDIQWIYDNVPNGTTVVVF